MLAIHCWAQALPLGMVCIPCATPLRKQVFPLQAVIRGNFWVRQVGLYLLPSQYSALIWLRPVQALGMLPQSGLREFKPQGHRSGGCYRLPLNPSSRQTKFNPSSWNSELGTAPVLIPTESMSHPRLTSFPFYSTMYIHKLWRQTAQPLSSL